MSDEKIIKVIANAPPEAKITVKELNTNINTPAIEVKLQDINTANLIIKKEPVLKVELDGYGERIIPEPTLIKFTQNLVNLNDVFIKESIKTFNETSNLTEFLDKDIDKSLAETTITSDILSASVIYNRIISDASYFLQDYIFITETDYTSANAISVSDLTSLYLSKTFHDYKNINEQLNISYTKSFIENPLFIADILETQVEINKIENAIIADSKYIEINKSLTNSFETLETFSKDLFNNYNDSLTGLTDINSFYFSKELIETVITTDDVLGEANIDDDQYAFFEKVSKDTIFVNESFDTQVDFLRIYSETSVISEIFTSDYFKQIDESIDINEILSKDLSKSIVDLKLTSDISYYEIIKVETDIVSSIDEFKCDIDSNAIDNINFNDIVNIQSEKSFEEFVEFNEVFEKSVQKSNIEPIDVLDLFEKDLNKQLNDLYITYEITSKDVFSEYNESISFTDFTSKLINSSYIEIVNHTDSTTLEFIKDSLEIATVNETSSFLISPFYIENIKVTDDVLGEANVDDDQYAFFEKVAKESVNTLDTLDLLATFNREYFDVITLNEQISNIFDKNILDVITNTDTINFLSNKIVIENIINTDNTKFDFLKSFIETVNTPNIIELSLDNQYFDIISNFDVVNLIFDKNIINTAITNEIISFENSKDLYDVSSTFETIGKQVSVNLIEDNYPNLIGSTNLVDILQLNTTKALNELTIIGNEKLTFESFKEITDVVSTSEQMSFNFHYNLSDIVINTDDFYGLANADDDQTAWVGKGLLEDLSVSETFITEKYFQRLINEFSVFTDFISFNSTKIINEITNVSNPIALYTTKVLSDSFSNSDVSSSLFTKAVLETATTSEYKWANMQSYLNTTYVSGDFVGSNYTI